MIKQTLAFKPENACCTLKTVMKVLMMNMICLNHLQKLFHQKLQMSALIDQNIAITQQLFQNVKQLLPEHLTVCLISNANIQKITESFMKTVNA